MHLALLFAQTDAGNAGGIFAGAAALMIVFWIVAIAASIFWLWMLIDAVVNEPTTERKILWFLVVFFLHILGALIYFFVERSGRTRSPTTI